MQDYTITNSFQGFTINGLHGIEPQMALRSRYKIFGRLKTSFMVERNTEHSDQNITMLKHILKETAIFELAFAAMQHNISTLKVRHFADASGTDARSNR